MNQKNEPPNMSVKVRFNIDISSKEASEKLETEVFNNAVKEDIELFSLKNCKNKKVGNE